MLTLLESASAILREAELLCPTHLTLDGWMDTAKEERASGLPEATVTVTDGFTAAAQPLLDGEFRGHVPIEVTVHGRGRIIEPSGVDYVLDDILTLVGLRTSRAHLVYVNTSCDAWLPHDLLGAPQPGRYALNAPRLEQALERIDKQLGVAFDAMQGKYAVIEGFRVTNLTYRDGDVFVPEGAGELTEGETCTLLTEYDRVTIGPRIRAGSGDEVRLGYPIAKPEARVLVTLTLEHSASKDDLSEQLALDVPGIAPLRWIGDSPAAGPAYEDTLIEDLPDHAHPAIDAAPLSEEKLLAIGIACADVLAAAHAAGLTVNGVCPELIYLDRTGQFAAIVPRGRAFIASAPQRAAGLRSYVLPYEGYEALVEGRPSGPPGDVFALCATLHHLATGRHPFGRDFPEIMQRVMAKAPDPYPGSPRVGEILARGLDLPEHRPSAGQLAEALRAANR